VTSYRPGAVKRYAPADGSSTRGGSTSVRGRVRIRMLAYCVYVLKVASSEGLMPFLVACPCTSFIVIFFVVL